MTNPTPDVPSPVADSNAAASALAASAKSAAAAVLVTPSSDVAGFYEAYASLTRTLRGWLVAFGIGTPVLVASQKELSDRLGRSDDAQAVLSLFMFGVSIQIAATIVYKAAMWYCYRAAEHPARYASKKRYKISDWISEQLWLELGFDFVTIGSFVAAMYKLLHAVL